MNSKLEKIASFDPNGVGLLHNNIYGLPFTEEESDIILFPVPWDVTTSYSAGTSDGPKSILAASYQVDLYDGDFTDTWKKGIFMLDIDQELYTLGQQTRLLAEEIIEAEAEGADMSDDPAFLDSVDEVNQQCLAMKEKVKSSTLALLKAGKKVGLVGGDHSTPLGYMEALAEVHGKFGILQVDAHADLRDAYEGFNFSHASIMFNALKIDGVEKLVQVGIRDICQDEVNIINANPHRITTFFDSAIKRSQYEGILWKQICEDIINALPDKVYISFDIDGLDPKLCPHTGTPVPGGFEVEQINYLLVLLKKSGKQIIGFDLNEVAPGEDELDALVGARLLFKLCGLL